MPGRQYGAPKRPPEFGNQPLTPGRTVLEPKTKEPDASPPTRVVTEFHKNASVDTKGEDMHHTLGINPAQASPGGHRHRGGDSELLLTEFTISGSKATNPAAVLATIIPCLTALGAKDATT